MIATLIFASGVVSYGITHYEKSFRHISGIVTSTEYYNHDDGRRRNPSLIIFLKSHFEPLKFTEKKDVVLKVKGILKEGDNVDIVINRFFNDIWGITVGNEEIISFLQEKEWRQYFASFSILYGLFLYAYVFLGKDIVDKIRWLKTRLIRKNTN
ncbi:MAG: hypothetical protein JZU65_17615 [Chlorobium sp.]|nr:hypothetical protein [Chlorobium sp.]